MIQQRTQTARLCDPLYFLHIPKTAGTSVRYWLHDLFGYHDWLPCHILEEVERLPREVINSHTFFSGHFSWRLFDHLDHTPNVVTWLRDPVDREWSMFRFIRSKFDELADIARQNKRADWLEYYEFVTRTNLRELLESHYYLGYSDNMQVRHLTGSLQSTYLAVDDQMLAIAMRNLQDMFAFGICEWMEPSVDLLSYRLQHLQRPMNRRLNKGEGTGFAASLSGEDVQLLREMNQYDQRLYEYARELFVARFRDFAEATGCDLAETALIEWLNHYEDHPLTEKVHRAIDEQFYRVHRDEPRTAGAVIRFADATPLRGWHPCVPMDDGTIVRWAGPARRASVFAPLEPGRRYRISATIHNYVSREVIRTMHFQLGRVRRPVSWYRLGKWGSSHPTFLVEAVFPADAIPEDSLLAELSVDVECEMGAFRHDPSTKVSFATDGFAITPHEEW